mmetsp:Transcript_39901/g.82073  ORF Transcript_39901/g.82073 Transcript_39901/m.82073 type:complete len:119 (-) Transcript_39901:3-359(-)
MRQIFPTLYTIENSFRGDNANFSIWELSLFIMIGCLGGLIGAVFNAANEHLTIWRMKRVNYSKSRRFFEVILVSLGVSTISFVMPLVWNRCTELPNDMQDWSNQVSRSERPRSILFQC